MRPHKSDFASLPWHPIKRRAGASFIKASVLPPSRSKNYKSHLFYNHLLMHIYIQKCHQNAKPHPFESPSSRNVELLILYKCSTEKDKDKKHPDNEVKIL